MREKNYPGTAQIIFHDVKIIIRIEEIGYRLSKGLRAESARAVTGRRNSHRWEGGRLFELSAGFF